MLQTLVWIPAQLWGWNVFGIGWLLVLWIIISVVVAFRQLKRSSFSKEFAESLPVLALVAGGIIFLLPRLLEISPTGVLGLPIRGFGVMLLLAIVAAVGTTAYRAKQVGIDPEHIISLAFWTIIVGIAGARLFYVIQYWPKFAAPTMLETLGEILNATKGGLVFYGSMIGGMLAGWIYLRKHKLPFWEVCDLAAPGMILGQAIGRIGCFFNGCCYGGLCTLPFAVTFPQESPVYFVHREAGILHGVDFRVDGGEQGAIVGLVIPASPAAESGLKAADVVTKINGLSITNAADARAALGSAAGAVEVMLADGKELSWQFQPRQRSQPVHPTQIYSFIDASMLFFFLWVYYPFRRRPGEVFAWLITLHPISRILLEMIRMDEAGQFGTGLSISQIVSILILGIAAVLWWRLEAQGRVVATTGQ